MPRRWNSTCLDARVSRRPRATGDVLLLIRPNRLERFTLTTPRILPAMPATRSEPPGFPATIPSPGSLQQLHEVMVRCTRCSLFMNRTQVVPGSGPSRPDILFVGEAPGASEDREGIPFVGRSGELLEAMLEVAGISREEVFIANVIRCRPPKNRNPRAAELRACRGWMEEQVRLLNPRIVVSLGRYALQHFVAKARVTEVQGRLRKVAYSGGEIRLLPLVHPSAVLRDPSFRPKYEEQFRRLGRLLRSGSGD
ncbi:MAG: uracil-DNA glycosylase [Gemmatimonas sp.]|nr:uracil-DNA glycosylase [Gemmatimonas sp.]